MCPHSANQRAARATTYDPGPPRERDRGTQIRDLGTQIGSAADAVAGTRAHDRGIDQRGVRRWRSRPGGECHVHAADHDIRSAAPGCTHGSPCRRLRRRDARGAADFPCGSRMVRPGGVSAAPLRPPPLPAPESAPAPGVGNLSALSGLEITTWLAHRDRRGRLHRAPSRPGPTTGTPISSQSPGKPPPRRSSPKANKVATRSTRSNQRRIASPSPRRTPACARSRTAAPR
jgi:hypothetical protein